LYSYHTIFRISNLTCTVITEYLLYAILPHCTSVFQLLLYFITYSILIFRTWLITFYTTNTYHIIVCCTVQVNSSRHITFVYIDYFIICCISISTVSHSHHHMNMNRTTLSRQSCLVRIIDLEVELSLFSLLELFVKSCKGLIFSRRCCM